MFKRCVCLRIRLCVLMLCVSLVSFRLCCASVYCAKSFHVHAQTQNKTKETKTEKTYNKNRKRERNKKVGKRKGGCVCRKERMCVCVALCCVCLLLASNFALTFSGKRTNQQRTNEQKHTDTDAVQIRHRQASYMGHQELNS